jgi:excinuclease ABC subunit A
MTLFDKVVEIDQSPIGRTPRSNAATYTGLFTPLREMFAQVPEARARGYTPGRFSFNVRGGRCEVCEGDGLIKVEMHFLPDVYVPCDVCQGKRYNRETLEILYKGYTIADVLEMTVEEALTLFENVPSIARKLATLRAVGLDYIKLGQSATTLSGGEAQRVKLSRELSKRDTGNTLYILDEPTTGLHFHDIEQLLDVLHQLVDQGNTVVVIEHNLDVIKTADWIIDLGPEGGAGGGRVLVAGTPETVAATPESYTGQFLAPHLTSKGVKRKTARIPLMTEADKPKPPRRRAKA